MAQESMMTIHGHSWHRNGSISCGGKDRLRGHEGTGRECGSSGGTFWACLLSVFGGGDKINFCQEGGSPLTERRQYPI